MIVDIHTHAFPDDLAPRAIPALEEEGGVSAYHDGTLTGLVALMDDAGVDVSCVLPVATKATQVVKSNDWIAARASERILPFGTMHPDFEDPASEIARMASIGIRGFKMHPEYQEFEPLDPRMAAIYDAASANGLVLLLHAGGDIAFETVRGTPAQNAEIVRRWPDLDIVLAHMGGYETWAEVREHLVGLDVWFDTAYTLGHLPDDEFVALARAHGTDRVLFGTDSPWTVPAAEIARLRRIGFTESELADILGGNAARLLGL